MCHWRHAWLSGSRKLPMGRGFGVNYSQCFQRIRRALRESFWAREELAESRALGLGLMTTFCFTTLTATGFGQAEGPHFSKYAPNEMRVRVLWSLKGTRYSKEEGEMGQRLGPGERLWRMDHRCGRLNRVLRDVGRALDLQTCRWVWMGNGEYATIE